MAREVNTRHSALERILDDGSAEPMGLPFSVLQDITNCFSDDRIIGNGGFAVVYKGMVGHRMVAVKKLTNTFDLEETKFHKEVQCLVQTKHKNIVRFLGYCAETQGHIADFEGKFIMADTRNWLLCFEHVPNGSLDKYIADASRGLEWGTRFKIIKGICQGLWYLHDKRILHLDLKPANILIADQMVPKIANFGLSRCLGEEQTRIFTARLCGSIGYLAPEFFRGQVAYESDIYSLGVLIVEILTGEKGYPQDDSVVESWMNRLEGGTQLEQIRVCTKIGIECMELDPKKRPAARDIIDRLAKTESIVVASISNPSIEQEVSLLKEQQCQDRNGNTSADEIEDIAQRLQTLGNDQCKEKEGQWSAWRSRHMVQYRDHPSVSSSNSSVVQKLSLFYIFNRKSHRNFTRNGGPTVQQSNSVKIFREEKLKHIFDELHVVARGGFGNVYRGILGNRLVAVRKPIAGSLGEGEDFAKEVIKRYQVIHKNVLRFIGCCLEVDTPMLVYEFFNNGSLYDILQSKTNMPLDLGVRLRIAAHAADGLAYVHSATNDKILLADFKADNIFLDDKLLPKISNFGNVRSWPHLPSYYFVGGPTKEAPLFMENDQYIQERNIYSFGVIILELISRKDIVYGGDNLVNKFRKCHKEGKKATELFDKEIATSRDLKILDSLVEIAVECLSNDADARPSMTEVAGRLLRLSRTYTG